MALRSVPVSVTTAATLLTGEASNVAAGQSVLVSPRAGATLYVGGSDVSTSGSTQGTAVTYPERLSVDARSALYGVVATGTLTVDVIRDGVN